jgi:hypothetical protein
MQQVFVILFNARSDNEGIHSLQVQGRNVILMFENEDDALRFGGFLEAQDFPPCTVEKFNADEIEEFCVNSGYDCRLIPEGTLITPPESQVEDMEWDPNGPPSKAPWVRDEEPDPDMIADMEAEAKERDRAMSEAELDRIRRQLEGLL